MKIAYCKECEEVIAVGNLLGKPDRKKPSTLHKHQVKGDTHFAFLAEVPDSPMTEKEVQTPQKYLDRIAKENAALFK